MTQAIITISQVADDELKIKTEFEPAMQNEDAEHPLTHLAAIHAVMSIQNVFDQGEPEQLALFED